MRNISAMAVVMIALSVTSALPATAVNEGMTPVTTERVHSVPILEPIVDVTYVGIGGPGPTSPDTDNDCLDSGEIDAGTGSTLVRYPAVAVKATSSQTPLLDETSVESAELTDLCKATIERLPAIGQCADPMAIGVSEGCDVTYASEPQRVGVGRSRAYINQSIDVSMDFADEWEALSDQQLMTCRIANPRAASTVFSSTRNRGLAGLDVAIPNERLVGVLDPASCVDQTEFLVGDPGPGTVSSLANAVPITTEDPGLDLGPGLWVTCISTTARHRGNFALVVLQDTTWFWIDSPGNSFSLRDLWGDANKWDGDTPAVVAVPNHCGTGPGGIGPVGFPL